MEFPKPGNVSRKVDHFETVSQSDSATQSSYATSYDGDGDTDMGDDDALDEYYSSDEDPNTTSPVSSDSLDQELLNGSSSKAPPKPNPRGKGKGKVPESMEVATTALQNTHLGEKRFFPTGVAPQEPIETTPIAANVQQGESSCGANSVPIVEKAFQDFMDVHLRGREKKTIPEDKMCCAITANGERHRSKGILETDKGLMCTMHYNMYLDPDRVNRKLASIVAAAQESRNKAEFRSAEANEKVAKRVHSAIDISECLAPIVKKSKLNLDSALTRIQSRSAPNSRANSPNSNSPDPVRPHSAGSAQA